MKTKRYAYKFIIALLLSRLCIGCLQGSESLDNAKFLARLSQNVRPFLTLRLEFTTENLEKDGKWKLAERKQIAIDFQTGHYKTVAAQKEGVLQERIWDGKRCITVLKNMGINEKLSFENVSSRNILATISSESLFSTNFFPILGLYNVSNLRQPLYERIIKNKKLHIIKSESSWNLVLNGYIVFSIDPKTGIIKEKQLRFIEKDKEGKSQEVVGTSIKVEKHILKDGWFFPISTICTYSHNTSVVKKRITVLPETIFINESLKDALTVKLPIGTHVTDSITGKTYITTEFDALTQKESVSKEIDKLVETIKSEKNKK